MSDHIGLMTMVTASTIVRYLNRLPLIGSIEISEITVELC